VKPIYKFPGEHCLNVSKQLEYKIISKFIIIDAISISYYVEYFRHKFTRACEIERQDKMKQQTVACRSHHPNLFDSQNKMCSSYFFKVWCTLSKAP
jgi:hypothetical protein